MSRTKGAVDLKKRKIRSDRKRKYVQHKGKMIPYKSKRMRGDNIKIWFWERVPMSKLGIQKWTKKARPRVCKKITLFHIRCDVPPSQLSNIESIKKLALDVVGHKGEFLIMGFGHGKNIRGVKPVKLCRVNLIESRNGLVAFVSETHRLSRYWFWQK